MTTATQLPKGHNPFGSLEKKQRALVINAIERMFRDTADCDYIAARELHRMRLDQQFLWAALQAIEKYLKGILVFNAVSTHKLGHKIVDAYDKVVTKVPFDFKFPPTVREFIARIEMIGADRYFERPFATTGYELIDLDFTVWYVRRYCQFLGPMPFRAPSGAEKNWSALTLRAIQSSTPSSAATFKISGGYLERVLEKGPTAQRSALVWKNPCFGARTRKKLRPYTIHMRSASPTHFLHPGAFDTLAPLVAFTPPVKDYFRKDASK